MRIIKKYSNRRLYDTHNSKYVTLSDIAEFIAKGDEIKVIDHETGDDITGITLAQIIMEQEKSLEGEKSGLLLLTELIKRGKEKIKEFVERSIITAVEAVSLTKERARKIIEEHVKSGRISKEEGERIYRIILEKMEESRKIFREEIKNVIKEIIKEMDIPSREEIKQTIKKVESLDRKLSIFIETIKKLGE